MIEAMLAVWHSALSKRESVLQVAGQVTGFGNPTWKATHGPASKHAQAVQVGILCRMFSNAFTNLVVAVWKHFEFALSMHK